VSVSVEICGLVCQPRWQYL